MPLHDQSILDTIKGLLNIESDDTSFDQEIMVHINSSFTTLHSLGVGPSTPFAIESKDEKWSVFLQDLTEFNSVKTLIYYEVRLAFDPPSTSFGISSFERMRDELQWRLKTTADPGVLVPEVTDPLDI